MATVLLDVDFVTEDCCTCGFTFAIPQKFKDRKRQDRNWFWCPSCGKPMRYTGATDAEIQRREAERQALLRIEAESQLAAERARHDQTRADRDAIQRSATALKGVVTKTKNRIGKGVCPCCNRHFQNVERHMHTKHPGYAETGK